MQTGGQAMARFFPLFNFKKKANDLRYSSLLPTWRTTTDAKWYEWRTDRAIREGLKSSSYVYACVQIIARSMASVPWYVYRQNANGDWLKVDNHPLQKLIERPTPWHSRKDLMVGMAQHLYFGRQQRPYQSKSKWHCCRIVAIATRLDKSISKQNRLD